MPTHPDPLRHVDCSNLSAHCCCYCLYCCCPFLSSPLRRLHWRRRHHRHSIARLSSQPSQPISSVAAIERPHDMVFPNDPISLAVTAVRRPISVFHHKWLCVGHCATFLQCQGFRVWAGHFVPVEFSPIHRTNLTTTMKTMMMATMLMLMYPPNVVYNRMKYEVHSIRLLLFPPLSIVCFWKICAKWNEYEINK